MQVNYHILFILHCSLVYNNFICLKCIFRYVLAAQNKLSYTFIVPYKGCGSKPSCAICNSIDNILVIQNDEEVQGLYDTARKISCSRTGVEEEKRIFFKPFVVDMLEVITVETSNGGVDCWMDIQRGKYPRITPIGEVIKIGEELTVLVYLRDEPNEFDLIVRNCWAYDNEDFDAKGVGKVQLSDASGCSRYIYTSENDIKIKIRNWFIYFWFIYNNLAKLNYLEYGREHQKQEILVQHFYCIIH